MRKMAFVLAVVLLVTTLSVPALAAQPRAITVVPSITVNGTSAKCDVTCSANYITDELVAIIRLYRGSTLIATWREQGEGYIIFSETKSVTSGYKYTLTVDLTVNGNPCPTASASDS